MSKFFAILLWVVSLIVLGFGIEFEWFLRDGLAPGVVESHGTLAWQRFWDGGNFLWLLVWVVPPFVLGCFIYPLQLRKQHLHNQGATASNDGIWPPPPAVLRKDDVNR
jgi:hypothetical protein